MTIKMIKLTHWHLSIFTCQNFSNPNLSVFSTIKILCHMAYEQFRDHIIISAAAIYRYSDIYRDMKVYRDMI